MLKMLMYKAILIFLSEPIYARTPTHTKIVRTFFSEYVTKGTGWVFFLKYLKSCDEMNDPRHLIVEHIKGSIFKIKNWSDCRVIYCLKEFTGLRQRSLVELLFYRNA